MRFCCLLCFVYTSEWWLSITLMQPSNAATTVTAFVESKGGFNYSLSSLVNK